MQGAGVGVGVGVQGVTGMQGVQGVPGIQGMQPPGSHAHAPGMPFNTQAIVAQQNNAMEVLERRRERERARERSGSIAAVRVHPRFYAERSLFVG